MADAAAPLILSLLGDIGIALLWHDYALPVLIIVAKIVAILIPLLLAIAYWTFAERVSGPNRNNGRWGAERNILAFS